jgi:pyrimidine-specific ribonucleoside hydrolase
VAQEPRAVIVDTDAGPDDLIALAYLLARADVAIEAITISYGLAHQDPGARIVLSLLDSAGRKDIPVFKGRETPRGAFNPYPVDWRTGADNVGSLPLPRSTRVADKRPAVDFLVERLQDGSRPVDVLALGALTNLAEVLERAPRLPAIRSLVIMGGALDVPGNLGSGSKENTTAEWNLYADPPAAQRVFAAGLPVLLVPLDATNAVRVTNTFVLALKQHGTTPLGRLVSAILASASERIGAGLYYAWDPLAAMAMIDRSVVKLERLPLSVQLVRPEDGRTLRGWQAQNMEVALGADATLFFDKFVTALSPH